MINWPWSKMRTIKCPDGTTRYVYRRVDDAFPYYFENRKTNLSSIFEAAGHGKVDLGATIESTIANILFKIDEKNSSVQQHLRAAYVTYTSNPCAGDSFLKDAVSSIRNTESDLRTFDLAVKRLDGLLSALNVSPETNAEIAKQVTAELGKVTQTLERGSASTALANEMEQVSNNTTEWQKP